MLSYVKKNDKPLAEDNLLQIKQLPKSLSIKNTNQSCKPKLSGNNMVLKRYAQAHFHEYNKQTMSKKIKN